MIILLMLPLYLLSHAGLAYSLHLCGKAITSFSFSENDHKTCACTKSKSQATNDCCKEQSVDVATDEGQASFFSFKTDASKILLWTVFSDLFSSFLSKSVQVFGSHSLDGPPLAKVPLYLLACVFLI